MGAGRLECGLELKIRSATRVRPVRMRAGWVRMDHLRGTLIETDEMPERVHERLEGLEWRSISL